MLVVQNPTAQAFDFYYTTHSVRAVLSVPAGGQAQFPDDLGGHELQVVIDQLERYGAVPHDDPRAVAVPTTFVYRVVASPIEAAIAAVSSVRPSRRAGRQRAEGAAGKGV